MFTNTFLAAGALLSVVAAVPMAKRDIVWVTEVDEAVVTVPVTTTVWVNPGESVPTTEAAPTHYGHHHRPSGPAGPPAAPSAPSASAASSEAAPSSYVASSSSTSSSSSSSSSVYIAPSTTSTSVYVAPTPSSTSTSIWVAPTTSSTSAWVASTTTSTSVWVAPSTSEAATPTSYGSAPAAASCTNAASSSQLSGAAGAGSSYSGDLTYYAPGMGACGCVSAEGDHIVAVSESLFDQYMPSSGNPNLNPLCGRQVSITGTDGTAYPATIVDRCTGCKEEDLDLTETFFNTVTGNGDGRVHNMKWSFIN